MIPTRYKRKLPRALSYAVGAQALSEALEGVPQYNALGIAFSDFDVRHASLRPGDEPRRVLEASYRSVPVNRFTPRSWDESSGIEGSGPRWDLTVHALPREEEALVRPLLEPGLARLRAWLIENAHPYETQTSLTLRVLFDPDALALAFRDTWRL